MRKFRLKEAPVDYGDYPERMDPNLERKLGSPESLYAKNPAFKKGAADVERLAGKRFKEVVDRVRDAFDNPDLSSNQVKQQIMQQMMGITQRIMSIESRHKEELEQLALDLALDETGTNPDWYQFELTLGGMPPRGGFQMKQKEKPKFELPKNFDIDTETDEEQFQSEVDKRNIVNLIIQGEAKKGHYSFMKPGFLERVEEIDPQLPILYRQVMAANDLLYFTMEQMIEMMSQTGSGVAGKMELQDADDDDEGGEGSGDADTKIVATGIIFPILLHEIIKGLEEAPARHQFAGMDPSRASSVRGQTDILPNEPMQLRLGPALVEKLNFVLPDEMFDPENRTVRPWFKTELYKVPAKEFLDLIAMTISEDSSDNDKARRKFNEIMQKSMEQKRQYDDAMSGSSDDEDDDEDFDDLFKELGIK